jgi:hypothetical protein
LADMAFKACQCSPWRCPRTKHGFGCRHLVHSRLSSHPPDEGLAGNVDRMDDCAHHAAQLLCP